MRRGAAPERAIVHGILEKELEGNSFLTEEIPIRRTFGGLSSELLRFIDAEKPTFLFQLGAGILPGRFIERTAPILNLHPGILPGIRGVEPLFWAHYYGKAEWFGTTLHYIDAGIDTGAPLIRKRFAPQKNEHYAFSVKRQIFVEQDLLRSFVSAYPHNVSALDEGGCEGSVYRTAWAKEHYHALEAANWWNAAPLEDRPKLSARPAGAGTNRI
jgi:folate-dependent phosphoribosylglycinamide formyltransferase PurN